MKNLSRSLLVAAALAVGLASVPALAQGRGGPGAGAGPGAQQHGPRPEMRKEIRERIQQKVRTYMTVELSSRLGLDEKKSLKLSEAIQAHMDRRQSQRQKLKDEAQKLRGLVDSKANDAQVKAQLDTVLGLAGRDDEMMRFVQDTGKFLTVQEQAKLALAMPEIMKDMKGMMREARGEMRGGRGRFGGDGGGGPGGLDDDDDAP